jgi:hypothetical protein
LAAWSKSSEKRRHGFTVCRCREDWSAWSDAAAA